MTNYSEGTIGNICAERARRHLSQASIAESMRALGFTAWRGSTVSLTELGKRRLTVDELFGLAEIMQVPVVKLLDLG